MRLRGLCQWSGRIVLLVEHAAVSRASQDVLNWQCSTLHMLHPSRHPKPSACPAFSVRDAGLPWLSLQGSAAWCALCPKAYPCKADSACPADVSGLDLGPWSRLGSLRGSTSTLMASPAALPPLGLAATPHKISAVLLSNQAAGGAA